MKALELMIGDWVNVPEIGNVRVKAVYPTMIIPNPIDDNIHASIGDEYLTPIPLTAEILNKNKFSKSVLMGEQRHFTYYLAPSVSLLAIYDADFSLRIGDCARYIKHVHELQHALRLCGINKEIML